MKMLDDQCRMRSIVKCPCRSTSTINRKIKRTVGSGIYEEKINIVPYISL